MKTLHPPSPSPQGGEGRGEGLTFLLLILALTTSCGYRFTAPNSSLPVKSARVTMFQNRTAEPAAEMIFTQAAKDQLDRAGRLGGADAEGELEGVILGVGGGPFLTAPSLPKQPVFRIYATLSLTLKKGGVSVAATTVGVTEEFPSGADVLLTESNRAAALHRLADAAIREGFERLQAAP